MIRTSTLSAALWATTAVLLLGAANPGFAQTATTPAPTQQTARAQRPPNILVIWGDDIGQFNVSAYNMGMMGPG